MNSNEIEQKGLKNLRNCGIIFAVLAVALIVSGSFLIAKPFNGNKLKVKSLVSKRC